MYICVVHVQKWEGLELRLFTMLLHVHLLYRPVDMRLQTFLRKYFYALSWEESMCIPMIVQERV